MQIDTFALERWLDRYEADADVMLGESGVRAVKADRFDTDPGRLGYVVPTNGDPAFRERVAARYDRGPEEVVFTCGTQEANLITFLSLLDRGRHAVVVTPTYQSLTAIPAALAEVTTVPLDPPAWTLDPDAVADAIRPETDLIVVNTPNNPTGRAQGEDTLRGLYDLAVDADAYLLGDEVYRMLDPDPHPPVASLGPRAVSTSGLSKAWGLPGLRFGWLAGPPEVVSAATHWKDYTTISPPQFGQYVARQAFNRADELLGEHRDLAAENRDRVAALLTEYGMSWTDPAGVVGFPTIPDGFADSRTFCRSLVREESVLLVPGDVFGHPDRFRIGFGTDPDVLATGLDRLRAFFDRRH